MNHSSGENSPSLVPRFPLSTRLLLGSLAIFFIWYFYSRVQDYRYTAMVEAGTAELAKKDLTHARGHFDAFLRAHATTPSVYPWIGNICAEHDQPALAVEYMQRGLDACKDASNTQRAQLYESLSVFQALAEPAHPQTKAIASARLALKLDPTNPEMQNAVGYLLADNDQDLVEAEKLLRQALQSLSTGDEAVAAVIRPGLEDSYGWLLYKKGDYANAVIELTQASEDIPPGEDGRVAKYFYYHLGAAYRKAGQIEDARRALDIALHYDPTFPEAKAEEALLPPPGTPAATQSPASAPPASVPPANPPASAPTPTTPSSSTPAPSTTSPPAAATHIQNS